MEPIVISNIKPHLVLFPIIVEFCARAISSILHEDIAFLFFLLTYCQISKKKTMYQLINVYYTI